VTFRGGTSRRVPEVGPVFLEVGGPGEWDKLAR